MKCKFERKTIYDNQVFLANQTYELSKRDAEALGFVTSTKEEKTEEQKEEKAKK